MPPYTPQTNPLRNYAPYGPSSSDPNPGLQGGAAPSAPIPWALRASRRPLSPGTIFPSALWAAVIGGANELGRNLHRVRRKEITMAQAVARSVMRGAANSLATTTASVLTYGLEDQSIIRLVALAATTTGLTYFITYGARSDRI